MKHSLLLRMLVFCLAAVSAESQDVLQRTIDYRPGDWVTYAVSRFPTGVSYGDRCAYFGSENGITRYDYGREVWADPFTVSSGMADDRIRVVAMDAESGVLWCAARTGLSYYVPGIREWRNISYAGLGVDMIVSIGSGDRNLWLESGDGRLFTGSRPAGPFSEADEAPTDRVRWQGRRQQSVDLPLLFMDAPWNYLPEGAVQDNHFRTFPVSGAVADRFNTIWLTVHGLGGARANAFTAQLELLPFGPYTEQIRCMAWDGQGMWMGGRNSGSKPGGISFWNMEEGGWTVLEAPLHTGFYSDRVFSIAPDTAAVWFGTDRGLVRYKKKEGLWRTYTVRDNMMDEMVTSTVISGAVLWAGTAGGINRIGLPGETIEQIRDELVMARHIYHLEPDGNDLWAATDRGLVHYDHQQDAWTRPDPAPGMQPLKATAVSAYASEVWAGTDDGVQMLDKATGTWQGFPAAHYPVGGMIHTVLADNDAVWFGTDSGLVKYLKKEKRWRRFTTEDGLRHNRVYWLLLDGDYLWAGTAAGLTRFYWNAPYRTD